VVLTDDPDFVPPAGGELTGVPFGMRPASGSGNGVIDDMARGGTIMDLRVPAGTLF
jgi:hypothetical protein